MLAIVVIYACNVLVATQLGEFDLLCFPAVSRGWYNCL